MSCAQGKGVLGNPEEYFNRERISRRCPQAAGGGRGGLTEFIESTLVRQAVKMGGIISAKLFWFELGELRARFNIDGNEEDVLELIGSAFGGARFVRLVRKDKVRQAISYIIAYKTGVWWSLRGEDHPPRSLIEPSVTFQEIHYWVSKIEYWEDRWNGLLEKDGHRTLTIHYEDLMNDLKVTVKKVAAHLGRELKEAEIKSVTSPLLRQSDSRTESLVSKYIATGSIFQHR
jgi:LPS sulfotransferase NodH